jgi:hypothetical protein
MLYPIKRNDKYGFINDMGNIVVVPQFSCVSNFSNNVCAVFNNLSETEISVVDTEGNLLFPFIKHLNFKYFSEELAFARHQQLKKWGIINKQGENIVPFIFNDDVECEYSRFSNGLARIKKNEKYGFINSQTQIVIPFEYDAAHTFSENYVLVRKNKNYFWIDKKGNVFNTGKYKPTSNFKNGLAQIQTNEKIGFINTKGEIIIDCIFDEVYGDFTENFCAVKINSKCGIIDEKGNKTSDFIFDEIRYFINGVAPAKIGKKWTLIDYTGKMLFEPKYNFIEDFGLFRNEIDYPVGSLTRATIRGKDFYIDKNGNIICEKELFEKNMVECELKDLLKKHIENKAVWDKAKWSYDGFTVTKKGAIRPFYFVLKWLKNKNLLTKEGIEWYNKKNNLDIGLYRSMVKEKAALFFDYFYDYWFANQHITNYQIDCDLEFEEDENLDKLWNFYISNSK